MSNRASVKEVSEVKTFEVCFKGFEGLPTTKGAEVQSSMFKCFDCEWRIELTPGGDGYSDEDYVRICLRNMSASDIRVNTRFTVKESAMKAIFSDTGTLSYCSNDYETESSVGWGPSNFAPRSDLIKVLKDGGLVVEVRMEKAPPPSQPFIPKNPLCGPMLEKFMEKESADVIFDVGGKHARAGRKKKAKTSSTKFYAHLLILEQCAPELAELCKSRVDMEPIQINDVQPAIFRFLLHYVYGGKVSDEDMEKHAKDIIDASDKWGIVNLKLGAEACYVESTQITIDNLIDNLLYADCKNCALLKEVAIDFVLENGDEVLEKISFDDLPGGLFGDLLAAVNGGKKKGADSEDDDWGTMRVNDLRRMLDEKKMSFDGSRKTMIAALKGLKKK